MNCATDLARESGGPPGVRLRATSAGSLPTDEIATRCVTGSTTTPCTPGRPLKVACVSTRLSRHARRHAFPGTTAQSSPGVGAEPDAGDAPVEHTLHAGRRDALAHREHAGVIDDALRWLDGSGGLQDGEDGCDHGRVRCG